MQEQTKKGVVKLKNITVHTFHNQLQQLNRNDFLFKTTAKTFSENRRTSSAMLVYWFPFYFGTH